MRVTCPNCGGGHPKWDCKAPAKKSTAARSNRVMVDRKCEVCASPFTAIPGEVNRGKARTCSKACAAKLAERPDQSGEKNPNWKGGVPSSEIKRGYKQRHPEKAAAHSALTGALRRGELTRQPCEVCGELKTEGHHEDYSKPLEVRWLCKPHHLAAHSGRFGTQALPVDTKPKRGRKPLDEPTPRQLYQRELMRERRARLKAEKNS